jgi:hypothetical protein
MSYADEIIKAQRAEIGIKNNIINGQAEKITDALTAISILKMKLDAVARDVLPLPTLIERIERLEANQAKNIESRKKFEAGYWQKVGE